MIGTCSKSEYGKPMLAVRLNEDGGDNLIFKKRSVLIYELKDLFKNTIWKKKMDLKKELKKKKRLISMFNKMEIFSILLSNFI